MAKILNKEDLDRLPGVLSGYDVYAPVSHDGVLRFCRLEEDSDQGMETGFTNTHKPPKDLFFPQTEVMLELKREDHKWTGTQETARPTGKAVALGMRPCDAQSLNILDVLFTWDYVDNYYINNRNRFTIVGLACTGGDKEPPTASCFCTSVGGGPGSKEGLDVIMTDIGNHYLFEALTDKGRDLEAATAELLSQADDGHVQQAKEAVEAAEKKISRKMPAEGSVEYLDGIFDHDYWEGFAQRCLGCGICTLLCPTCHCFDINDVVKLGEGRRERTWDSCQFEYYSIHASGHNPRPAKKHRQRNRIYHKFHYMVKNLDVLGCVGCGRCIEKCPVNIDIIEVMQGAKEAAKEAGKEVEKEAGKGEAKEAGK